MRDAAQFFKILADEARLKIVWLLFHHDELCVCDIMAALGITQSKASRHLATLKHAGLVTDRKDGLWSYYAMVTTEDEFARQQLHLLKETLGRRAEAGPLLAKLRRRLDAKNRGAACATDGSCVATRKAAARRLRARLTGGTQ